MENTLLMNMQAMTFYRITHGNKNCFELFRKNLKKIVEELKVMGFRCVLCGGETMTAESFRADDFSAMSRCPRCKKLKTRMKTVWAN